MSEIILNDEWDDWDQEFDYRVDHFKKMVDEDCAVVFYSILDAISTLDMSLQAPDIETYKKVIADRDARGKKIEKIYAKALSYCEECEVKAECLAFAIEYKCLDGVWGNLLPDQRKGLHNHRKVRDLLKERKKK